MDHVIIYKKNDNLKETFERVILTRSHPYSISFSVDDISLKRHLKTYPKAILFYMVRSLADNDRIKIRNIQIAYPNVYICLCSKESFALDAWKLRMFDFLEFPVTSQKVKTSFSYYIGIKHKTENVLVLKSGEGLVKIPLKDIAYLKADGNYTEICTLSNKKYLPTQQLHKFEYLTEMDSGIVRVNRSYIINMKSIKTLEGTSVTFYGGHTISNLSQRLSTKMKQILLGKSI